MRRNATVIALMIAVMLAFGIHAVVAQDIPARGEPGQVIQTLQQHRTTNDGRMSPNSSVLYTVLPGNGSTSGNGRAPQGSRLFNNTKYLITGAEMSASGIPASPITSVGWRWNVPRLAAAGAPAAQSVATTGNLKVFLKDTTGDAAGLIGTFIDTSGVGYTKVIDGTISITRTDTLEFMIDVPVGGPGTSPFIPAPGRGVLVIYVYQTTTPLATPLGAPTVFCTNVGALLTYQSQTANGTTGTASTFRPETRFGADAGPLVDIVQVPTVYALGKIPIPLGNPNIINVPVSNVSASPVTFDLTVTVKNASSGTVRYTNTQTVTSLAGGASQVVTFAGWSPTIAEDDSIVAQTSSIGGETNVANNRAAVFQNVNSNTFSYAQSATPTGGVGFNGATGDFIAKFTTNGPAEVNQVQTRFTTGGQPYNVGIWAATGGGTPGANIFTSAALTSSIGTQDIPISPAIAVNGSFFVGVKQTGTVNVSFAYQSETPIRAGTFYFTSPTGGTTWTDFAPANGFRFMVEARVAGPSSVPETAPREFSLSQNYPNPFNPSTEIKFSVENSGHATLDVFSMLGQKVATLFDGRAEAGQYYNVQFNAPVASGIYFYKLQSGTRTELKKMVLVK
jgi:hypothetical protein